MMERGIEINQIAYFADDLDAMAARLRPNAIWQKFRRTETIRLYPGGKEDTAVFYVAHRHDFMPGFEVELLQPLTDPTYINVLDLVPGQVAHLGVKADEFPGMEDQDIVSRLAPDQAVQMIQKGAVRTGRILSYKYSIYQVEEFLPVKIVRTKEEE